MSLLSLLCANTVFFMIILDLPENITDSAFLALSCLIIAMIEFLRNIKIHPYTQPLSIQDWWGGSLVSLCIAAQFFFIRHLFPPTFSLYFAIPAIYYIIPIIFRSQNKKTNRMHHIIRIVFVISITILITKTHENIISMVMGFIPIAGLIIRKRWSSSYPHIVGPCFLFLGLISGIFALFDSVQLFLTPTIIPLIQKLFFFTLALYAQEHMIWINVRKNQDVYVGITIPVSYLLALGIAQAKVLLHTTTLF